VGNSGAMCLCCVIPGPLFKQVKTPSIFLDRYVLCGTIDLKGFSMAQSELKFNGLQAQWFHFFESYVMMFHGCLWRQE
jgi:hypothetical protein